ncbi:MAG: GRP family sugar transporter [Steroidobacteraceae bacterium]
MYVPVTFSIALLMTITSAVCWGSWANTFKVTRGYRFELFYWDYALGICLIALLLAFTMGSLHPNGMDFMSNLHSADTANFYYAIVAGAIFNVANVLLVAGIDMAGLAVAFPLSIGIALAVGVILSYLQNPKGNAMLLGIAVVCAIVAVIFDGRAFKALNAARDSSTSSRTSRKSIVVCIVSGVLMGLFAPLVSHALNTGHAMTPYTVGVFFALGALACCFVFNVYLMRRPLVGAPVNASGYLRTSAGNHLLGLLGGCIWGLGIVFNLVASNLTGVAISYAIGQSAPMVAALWGVFVWHEFRGARTAARVNLVLMFAFFIAAIALVSLAYSAGG